MSHEVKVPSMGESITSGVLAAWHVSDGDTVKEDQVLYELETDKITSEGMAEASGVITLKAEEGEEVEIGQVIATIDESAAGMKKESAEDEKPEKEETGEEKSAGKSEESETPTEEAAEEEEDKGEQERGESHPALSPAVRKLVEENDLDVSKIKGTGKGGRLTKGDVQDYLSRQEKEEDKDEESPAKEKTETSGKKEATPPERASTEKAAQSEQGERVTRRKLSPLRKKIGERLVMAQQEAAILTTFNEVDMTAIMNLRKEQQEAFVKKHEVKLGFMSFFCKAAVHALKEVPQVNAQIEGDTLIENHYYDIGVAIGTDRGLIVPVIRDVDQLSFADIEKEIIRYARKAKEGKISIEDLQGGVFTISNGGVYGSLLSTPILNYPQSGILGMHTIQQRPMAIDGEVKIRPMMYLALSYDHRIVDGKEAVTFLIKIKEVVEDPSRLLFDL